MRVSEVDTPALLLDLDRVESNIAAMARFFGSVDASLRPHYKTPKCAEVVSLQLEAGAIGVTCAKLGEAESLVDAGVATSILIANQIIGPAKVKRAIALAARVPELIMAVDHVDQIDALSSALPEGVRLCAIVECDVGMHRCGTRKPEETVALARHIADSRLQYRGIMGYEGHAVLNPDAAKRKELADIAVATLADNRRALEAANLAPEIVSAGGTGTHDLTGAAAGITEIQAGSYVFMDGRYAEVRSDFQCALTIQTTVLKRSGRMLITDCGMKALSHEFGMPRGFDLPLGCAYLSEEHGHVVVDEGAEVDLAAGDRIRLLPSHGDTTINLHDRYYAFRGDEVEAVWDIVGRGKFV